MLMSLAIFMFRYMDSSCGPYIRSVSTGGVFNPLITTDISGRWEEGRISQFIIRVGRRFDPWVKLNVWTLRYQFAHLSHKGSTIACHWKILDRRPRYQYLARHLALRRRLPRPRRIQRHIDKGHHKMLCLASSSRWRLLPAGFVYYKESLRLNWTKDANLWPIRLLDWVGRAAWIVQLFWSCSRLILLKILVRSLLAIYHRMGVMISGRFLKFSSSVSECGFVKDRAKRAEGYR